MKILIRTDGGEIPEIGTGHVKRTIFLAKKLLIDKGFNNSKIIFISQNIKEYEYGRRLIIKEGFRLKKISKECENNLQELNEIKKLNGNIIIFDKLSINPEIIKGLKKEKSKVIVFDAKNESIYYADLIINALVKTSFKKKNLLEGSKYLITEPIEKKFNIKNKNKENIFICFGGYDYKNYTSKLLKIISQISHSCAFHIVTGITNNKLKKTIKELSINHENNFYFYENPIEFYKILAEADIAIVSGGLILYDCVRYGVPSISVAQYQHQKETILEFSKKGVTIPHNLNNKKQKEKLLQSLTFLLSNKNHLNIMKRKAQNLIDGKGVYRVIEAIKTII